MQNTPTRLDAKTAELFRAILTLRTLPEARQFFRDLLTSDEIREFGERWYVVQCLARGLSYREINQLSGLSLTTITRVAKWYKAGAGGYRLALQRTTSATSDTQNKRSATRTPRGRL